MAVPTRGQIRDIGPGISHKAQVVQPYLWDLQFTEIESRTKHSEVAIQRYLADFRQIAVLYARGAKIPEIRAASAKSARVIAEYVAIYERARREFPAAPRLIELLDVEARRTKKGPVGDPTPRQVTLPRPTGRTHPAQPVALQVLARVRLRQRRGYRGRHRRYICQVVRNYFTAADQLEPGQLV